MRAQTSSPASSSRRRADSEIGREVTIILPAFAGSALTTSSIFSSASLTTCPKEKNELYRKLGIGGIIRMDRDGKNREVYAIGLRNPVGMDFNPKDKALWTNDNQVDGMGDEQPPGELNRIASAGLDFGFPWYGGGKIRTNEYKNDTPPANVVFPQVEQAAHAADLGLNSTRAQCFRRNIAAQSSRRNTAPGTAPCRSARG